MTAATPARALTTLDDLEAAGLSDPRVHAAMSPVAEAFRIRITPGMLRAMSGPVGPVARQFLPDPAESVVHADELHDPIGDAAHSPVPGLTHRYADRAILQLTQGCEVYCRFCFRRESVGATGVLPDAQLDAALAHIAATPALREIILTGGDPLTVSPRRMERLMARLAGIAHLDVVRLHTRVPVVAPRRFGPEMRAAMGRFPNTWLVIHTNHADELTPEARHALAAAQRDGLPLLSQTVLLRGVNDNVEALEALFRTLLRCKVKPYYLHHADLARGTGHFRTTIAEGQAIMQSLRQRLSGIGLPNYVIDIPGGYGKVALTAEHARPGPGPGQWTLIDREGRAHPYSDPLREETDT